MSRIASAERDVAAPPDELFAYLADLEQHWQLADRFIEVVSLDRPAHGGAAHGRRRADAGAARHSPCRAHARGGRGTAVQAFRDCRGRIRHGRPGERMLHPSGGGTRVRLAATVERASPFDRTLLALGGRGWLERRFASILDTLARRVGAADWIDQSVSA